MERHDPPPSPPEQPSWVALKDDELLQKRICDLGVRIPGSELEGRVAQLYEELAARGVGLSAGLLSGRRVVLAGRRTRHRDSVLSGASTPEDSRNAPDAAGGRRNSRVVPATVAARKRPRHRSCLSLLLARRLARGVRQPGNRVLAGNVPAAALQQRLRAPSAELVCTGSSGRRFRRNIRGLAVDRRPSSGANSIAAGRRWTNWNSCIA